MSGFILLWSGPVVDIPPGWALCDGNNGTPDLRNKFIIGAGDTYSVDDVGGESSHDHTFTGSPHNHAISAGVNMPNSAPSGAYSPATANQTAGGTVNSKSTLPPYYALAYVMKL